MDVRGLCQAAGMAQKEGGWPARTVGEDIALMHSELSEALEEHRKGYSPTLVYYSLDKNGNHKPEGIPMELADTVIRIAAFCGTNGIDLAAAIADKMAYNRTRGIRHGGKII